MHKYFIANKNNMYLSQKDIFIRIRHSIFSILVLAISKPLIYQFIKIKSFLMNVQIMRNMYSSFEVFLDLL